MFCLLILLESKGGYGRLPNSKLPGLVALSLLHAQAGGCFLERNIEDGLLDGNGTGYLRGLNPFVTAYNTSLSGSSYDRAKVLSGALAQVPAAGHNPTHLVLHPYDLHYLRITRSTPGEYVLMLPTGPNGMSQLWGGTIVPSDRQAEGVFTAFDAGQALLRERMAIVIDISESHANHFVENKIAIRAEWRGQLAIGQSAAVVTGSLTSSPA